MLLLEGWGDTAKSLLAVVDDLKGSEGLLQFRRAIKSLKEGQISRLWRTLDQYVLELITVFQEKTDNNVKENW